MLVIKIKFKIKPLATIWFDDLFVQMELIAHKGLK